jgi:hypothetical protein
MFQATHLFPFTWNLLLESYCAPLEVSHYVGFFLVFWCLYFDICTYGRQDDPTNFTQQKIFSWYESLGVGWMGHVGFSINKIL